MSGPGVAEPEALARLAADITHDLANLEMMADELVQLVEEGQGGAGLRAYLDEFSGAIRGARALADRLRARVTP